VGVCCDGEVRCYDDGRAYCGYCPGKWCFPGAPRFISHYFPLCSNCCFCRSRASRTAAGGGITAVRKSKETSHHFLAQVMCQMIFFFSTVLGTDQVLRECENLMFLKRAPSL